MNNQDAKTAIKTHPAIPILSGAVYGLALWLLSKPLFHRSEPWDSNRAWLFFLLLFVGGFAHILLFRGSPRGAYWSIYLGQFIFGFFKMIVGDGDMFPLGAIVLLFCNLPVFVGAWLARFIPDRKIQK
jgi:hypothetical protein